MNFCLTKHLFGHKYLEIRLYTFKEPVVFDLCTKWTLQDNHAGYSLWISFYRVFFHFNIYDNRHWDYEKGKWCVYKEPKKGKRK